MDSAWRSWSREARWLRSGEALGRRPIHLLRRQHLRFLRKSRPIWKLYVYIFIYMYTYIYIHIFCVCATKTFHFARISWTQMCLKLFYRRHLVAESAAQGKLSYCSSQWRKMGLKPKWWGALKRGVAVIPWSGYGVCT